MNKPNDSKLEQGHIVRFKRACAQSISGALHGAGVDAGQIGIVLIDSRLTRSYLVRVGNPEYVNDRLIPYADSGSWIEPYAWCADSGINPRLWWESHWREYQPETRVIFRHWNGQKTWLSPQVVALLIDLPHNHNPNNPYDLLSATNCQMYEHLGGHGGGDLQAVIDATRPATPEEYAPLLAELQSAPYYYRLKVMKRNPSNSLARRRAALPALAAARA